MLPFAWATVTVAVASVCMMSPTLTPVTLGPGGSVSKLRVLVAPDGKFLSNDACTSYDCPAVSPLSSTVNVLVEAALLALRHVCSESALYCM